ncbi:MAG: hypothetical protein ACTS44_00935 [Candidatus Hodgkinia cicadicola]
MMTRTIMKLICLSHTLLFKLFSTNVNFRLVFIYLINFRPSLSPCRLLTKRG